MRELLEVPPGETLLRREALFDLRSETIQAETSHSATIPVRRGQGEGGHGMYLRDLPAIFAWEEPSETLTVLHARYVALLATRLGELMGRVTARGTGPEAADVGTLVDMAGAETLTAVLCAPEVSFRLLWPAHHDDTDALGFIGEALRGVVDRPPRSRLSHPLLVATDRDVLGPDGTVVARWPLARELPLDVASPFALSADVVGTLIRLPEPGPCLSANDVRATVLKLGGAVAEIADGVPPAWDVVRDFTKVVMLLPDRNAPSQFSSGSSGQFVGRTVLSNPHLPAVTQVHLAEALVHEAIHSVLYMDEQHDPWVLDPRCTPARCGSPRRGPATRSRCAPSSRPASSGTGWSRSGPRPWAGAGSIATPSGTGWTWPPRASSAATSSIASGWSRTGSRRSSWRPSPPSRRRSSPAWEQEPSRRRRRTDPCRA